MKKSTLSIGIPAHNEELNISNLLQSIIKQKRISYVMNDIYVVCDGCTDNTSLIVKKFSQKYKYIKLIEDKRRVGKSERLNTIYKLNKSDFVLTLDADIVLDTDMEIELMLEEMKNDKNVNVVGGRYIPIKQTSLMGCFSNISYLSFEDAFMKLNSGNNYYALMGCASLIRKNFSKTFTYPKGTISDQNYLYAMATKNNKNGVRIAKSTRILFKTVSTFKDWRILGVRSVYADKQNIVSLIGKDVLDLYTMPKYLLINSLMKWFFKSPFYTLGAIFMNMYIRKFPYKKVMPKNGMWTLTSSSKRLIFK